MPSEDQGKRGTRVTIVDVARHAGVSVAAASKVLRNAYGTSDSMHHRVRESMRELGYRPHRAARGMRGSTFTVGLMLPDIENPFFAVLTAGLMQVLEPAGYELLIGPAGVTVESQKRVLDGFVDYQMDGAVLVVPRAADPQLEEDASEIPTVLIGRHSDSSRLDSVASDDADGARQVVEYLTRLGHRSIAMVSNRKLVVDEHLPESVRLEGFLAAMTAAGLSRNLRVIDGRWSLEGGRESARSLLELHPRPTAVFAGADVTAFGIMSELGDRQVSVPESMSVVGYDNSPMSALGLVSLTTVDQAGFEMGRVAAQLLLSRIAGRNKSSHQLIVPTFLARSTTAVA
ncbi:transcriptional regulator, LacI family [Microbacterium sp. cf046]|uniref:LacI family DNA-binding transcriptional regulator n=1 Tax=Microbacterium sp. cf046 TaxID=1761803 RepID=UPI0008E760DD|nr:LacI family DNA-binding transcriptional regulator [Microbacterium sp. cf046]SFS16888.1 transcriptional regulator, LacI family [Microbacterium sp. cf046]